MSAQTSTVRFEGTPSRRSVLGSYIAATRPRHWLKNLLVFLPLAAAHRLYAPHLLLRECIAFTAFSLCAASIYLFNDLKDVVADRAHPQNRSRPLASGQISELARSPRLWFCCWCRWP